MRTSMCAFPQIFNYRAPLNLTLVFCLAGMKKYTLYLTKKKSFITHPDGSTDFSHQ